MLSRAVALRWRRPDHLDHVCLRPSSLNFEDSHPLPPLRLHHKLLRHELTRFESMQTQPRNQARVLAFVKEKKNNNTKSLLGMRVDIGSRSVALLKREAHQSFPCLASLGVSAGPRTPSFPSPVPLLSCHL